jgi:uncharacterized protein
MRNIVAVIAIVVLALVFAFRPMVEWFFGTPPDRIKPTAFSSDRLVRELAIAVDQGNAAAVAAVVKAGANVNARGADGYCLLFWAMARNNVRGFDVLLKEGADLDADYRDTRFLPDESYNQSVLRVTLGCVNPEFVKAVLKNGLQPDYVAHPVDGMTLMHRAAQVGATAVIETLLEAGADINRRDASGHTSLVNVMMHRDCNTAWFLMQRGADPTIKDDHGHDLVWDIKEYGSRGIRPVHRKSFELIVEELVRRGLLTHQDIVEADKPKTPNSGITVIEHSPDSEAGQELLRLDQTEREFYERQRREKMSQ